MGGQTERQSMMSLPILQSETLTLFQISSNSMKLPKMMYEFIFYAVTEDLKSCFSGHFTCFEDLHSGKIQPHLLKACKAFGGHNFQSLAGANFCKTNIWIDYLSSIKGTAFLYSVWIFYQGCFFKLQYFCVIYVTQ